MDEDERRDAEQPTEYIGRHVKPEGPATPDPVLAQAVSDAASPPPGAGTPQPPPAHVQSAQEPPHTGLHRDRPAAPPAAAPRRSARRHAGTADAIVFNGLTKHYGKTVGVEDLSMTVEKGEVFGFLGPNGAGKTTTLRLILNLIFPTAGSASIFGQDIVADTLTIRRNVGYVPGDVRLYGNLTGRKTLGYFAAVRHEEPVRLDSLLQRFDVEMNKKVRDMSRGNRQKLALLIAFAFDPELYILDEPTSGLDPLMQQEFYALIAEEKSRGKTVFFSSHILPEVDKVCDRVAILKEGHLLRVESIEELRGKKMRYAEVSFSQDVTEAELALPGVQIIPIERPRRFRIVIKGEINAVLHMLAAHAVDDLSITHAPLEETFLEYYGKGNNHGSAV